MKRQSEDKTALVYAYGCLPPTSGSEHVEKEVALQRKMWDALVDSAAKHREMWWAVAMGDENLSTLHQTVEQLSTRIDQLIGERRKRCAEARAKVDTPDLNAQIKEAADERRKWRKHFWEALSQWRKVNKDYLTMVGSCRKEDAKRIRQDSGLYWGNYLRVQDDFDRALLQSRKTNNQLRPSDPSRESGVLTVQIQRTASGLGATIEEIFAGKVNHFRIGTVNLNQATRGDRRRASRTFLDMRVDAMGHRLIVPLVLHRLPPPGSRIKRAQLVWRKDGGQIRWKLCMTVSMDKPVPEPHVSTTAVGVDLGWRLQADRGLLVATLVSGPEEHPRRLILPSYWMSGMDQVERLRSHLDSLTQEVAALVHQRGELHPMWWYFQEWRPGLGVAVIKTRELHDLIRRLYLDAKAEGALIDLPEEIAFWYARYRHLNLWRENLWAKLLRQRKELYRQWAREIATEHSVIVLEKFNLADVARSRKGKRPTATEDALPLAVRAQRQRACVHLLRKEIVHQAAKRNSKVVEASGPSTRTCSVCGAKVEPPSPSDRVWKCDACGALWDQDINAARNLLRSLTEDGPLTVAA